MTFNNLYNLNKFSTEYIRDMELLSPDKYLQRIDAAEMILVIKFVTRHKSNMTI